MDTRELETILKRNVSSRDIFLGVFALDHLPSVTKLRGYKNGCSCATAVRQRDLDDTGSPFSTIMVVWSFSTVSLCLQTPTIHDWSRFYIERVEHEKWCTTTNHCKRSNRTRVDITVLFLEWHAVVAIHFGTLSVKCLH